MMANRLSVVAALASLLVVLAASAAQAAVTSTFEQVAFLVPCGSEPFLVTGEWHIVDRAVTDATGGIHDAVNVNLVNVSGTSPSGVTYRGVGSYNNIFNFTNGADVDIQLHDVVTLRGTQGEPSLVMRIFVFLTTTPSGQGVTISRVTDECQ